MGAYSRRALIKFSPFSASEVCLFCNKTINANNKTRRSNEARFLYNALKKTPSSGKSLVRIYSLKRVGWGKALLRVWLGGGGSGRLFEAGLLLTFSTFRTGAYSRWALIRGWALIRINTVYDFTVHCNIFIISSLSFHGFITNQFNVLLCTGIAEVKGSNPVQAWILFSLCFRNYISCVYIFIISKVKLVSTNQKHSE